STSGDVKYGCVVYLWIFSVYAASTGCLGSRAGEVSPSAQACAITTSRNANTATICFIRVIFHPRNAEAGFYRTLARGAGDLQSIGRKTMQTGEGTSTESPVGVKAPVFWSIRKLTILWEG